MDLIATFAAVFAGSGLGLYAYRHIRRRDAETQPQKEEPEVELPVVELPVVRDPLDLRPEDIRRITPGPAKEATVVAPFFSTPSQRAEERRKERLAQIARAGSDDDGGHH